MLSLDSPCRVLRQGAPLHTVELIHLRPGRGGTRGSEWGRVSLAERLRPEAPPVKRGVRGGEEGVPGASPVVASLEVGIWAPFVFSLVRLSHLPPTVVWREPGARTSALWPGLGAEGHLRTGLAAGWAGDPAPLPPARLGLEGGTDPACPGPTQCIKTIHFHFLGPGLTVPVSSKGSKGATRPGGRPNDFLWIQQCWQLPWP